MKKYQPGGGLLAVPQAFKPDFDFLYKVGAERQSRYNAAERELGGLYTSLLNSDLSNQQNADRRDQWFKDTQAALDRITTTDLSLQTNLRAAKDVFDPILEDPYVSYDMAWSKRYAAEARRMQAYSTSPDANLRSRAWAEGSYHLNMQKERFANASLDETLKISAPRYVDRIDLVTRANEIVKQQFGDKATVVATPQGGWIVKTTNGPAVYDAMNAAIINGLQNDIGVRDMYRVMYEVQEDQFVKANGEGFVNADEARLAFAEQMISQNEEVALTNFYGKQVAKQRLAEHVESDRRTAKKSGFVPGGREETSAMERLRILQSLEPGELSAEDERLISTPAENIQQMRGKAMSVFANASLITDAQRLARGEAAKGYSVEYDENEFALINARKNADMQLKAFDAQLDVWKETEKSKIPGYRSSSSSSNGGSPVITPEMIGLPGGVRTETSPEGGIPTASELPAGQLNSEVLSGYKSSITGDISLFLQEYSRATGKTSVTLLDGRVVPFNRLQELASTTAGERALLQAYQKAQQDSRTLTETKDNPGLAALRNKIQINTSKFLEVSDGANTSDARLWQAYQDQQYQMFREEGHRRFFADATTGRPVSLERYIQIYSQLLGGSVEDNREDATEEYEALEKSYSAFYNKNATYNAHAALTTGDPSTGGLGMGSGAYPKFTTTFSGENPNYASVNMLSELNRTIQIADANGGQVIYQSGGLGTVGINNPEMQKLYQAVISNIISRQGDSDAPVFDLSYQSVVGGNPDRAGYTITLDSEYVKKWMDGNEDAAKLIADGNLQDLTFSIVFDKNFDGSSYRYSNQRVDGVQAQLNSSPDGNFFQEGPYNSSIRMTQLMDGTTNVVTRLGTIDPNTGELIYKVGEKTFMGQSGMYEAELANFIATTTQLAKLNQDVENTIKKQLGVSTNE